LFGAGVAGRAKNPINHRRLLQFPSERVLAAATADNENFHKKG
jgi:hypothetical protein